MNIYSFIERKTNRYICKCPRKYIEFDFIANSHQQPTGIAWPPNIEHISLLCCSAQLTWEQLFVAAELQRADDWVIMMIG